MSASNLPATIDGAVEEVNNTANIADAKAKSFKNKISQSFKAAEGATQEVASAIDNATTAVKDQAAAAQQNASAAASNVTSSVNTQVSRLGQEADKAATAAKSAVTGENGDNKTKMAIGIIVAFAAVALGLIAGKNSKKEEPAPAPKKKGFF